MTEPWILWVDDEPRILEGVELTLGFDYSICTASNGRAALELLQSRPGCGLIVSDLKMPGMDGLQLLMEARVLAPDTPRILLTGFGDLASTISAINRAGVFQFLVKPASSDALRRAVDEGLRQWAIVQSERVLLEQTLHGAAEALVEALEIASPAAFSRARYVESATRHVAEKLRLEPVWEIALAGLLARLGWIAVPPEIVDAFLAGKELTAAEQSMLAAASGTGVRLVGRIPRLDGVAAIIESLCEPIRAVDAAAVVQTVCEYDQLRSRGLSCAKAIKSLEGAYPSEILEALYDWDHAEYRTTTKQVDLRGVVRGMVAERDICTLSGTVLVRAGTDITETVIERLRNFSKSQGICEPMTVSVRQAAPSHR